MKCVNRVIISGRLVVDPEVRYGSSGTAVSDFAVAINSNEKVGGEWKERVDFIDVVCFGTTAENLLKYCEKGSGVLVDGRLRQDVWRNNNDQKRSKIKIIAESITYLFHKTNETAAEVKPEKESSKSKNKKNSDIPF